MSSSLNPTIYHEEWWLNAATNGNFDEILIESEGRTVGRLPFVIVRIRGRRTMCQMPNLTHCLGPGIDDGRGAECNRAIKRNLITRKMIEKLPKTTGFYQKFHSGIKDVITFQNSGFNTSVEFTYEIAPRAKSELWSGLRDKTRNAIRRASEQLEVTSEVSPEEFVRFYNLNLSRGGAISTYDYGKSIKICEEALCRRRGRLLAVRRADGTLSAAIFYIWDDRSAYYFMSTRSHDAHNGAISYLIWEAIQDASSRGLIFDFDGLGTKGSNLFYLGFGGCIAPRYTVHRARAMHRAIELVGNIARNIRRSEDFSSGAQAQHKL